MTRYIGAFFLLGVFLAGCATDTRMYKNGTKPYTVNGKTYYPMETVGNYTETGEASWYGPGFHGKKTSSGDTYNQNAFTAAHKTLPFGTRLNVKNLDNGRTTRVTVNDRGPFKSGRIIDLSRAAANDLGMIGTGTARVRIQTSGYSGATSGTTSVATTPVNQVTTSASSGSYYVQVGAFSALDNANGVATKLKNSGYNQHIASSNGNYVVRTGPYATKTAATAARDTLRKSYSGAFVVEK